MLERATSEAAASELHDLLSEFIEMKLSEPSKAAAFARAVIDHIRGRSSLMTELHPDIYAFSHPSLSSYLAARHVTSRVDVMDQLLTRLPERKWLDVAVGR